MLKRSYAISVILIAFAILTDGYAQGGASLLHIDKSFYVTGEVMWYKLYLPPSFAQADRVIEAVLVDDSGGIVNQHFHRNRGETYVSGYYKLPYDLSTGVYRLFFNAVHTKAGNNIPVAQARVPFYNDFDRSGVPAESANGTSDQSVISGELDIALELQEDEDRQGEVLEIQVKDASGAPVEANISVSVHDALLCSPYPSTYGTTVSAEKVAALSDAMVVKGTIFDKSGEPLQLNVLGAYQSAVERVTYSKSADDGTFSVKMPDFSGQRTVQFLGYSGEVSDFDVELARELEFGPIDDKVEYTEDVLEYLELSRKRKKIYQYFTSVETRLEPQHLPDDVQEIKPDFRFAIEEYEQFDNVFSFFDELITALTFDLEDSIYTAELQNPKGRTTASTHLSGDPLFIIDGKATRNADFVARMELSLIEYIDLYYDPYKLRRIWNAVGRSGVIVITTQLPDAPFPAEEMADIHKINGLQPEAGFPVGREEDGVPDLRPQILWIPVVSTDRSGTVEVPFAHSADLGAFRVQVVAQDAGGRYGFAEYSYKVEQ